MLNTIVLLTSLLTGQLYLHPDGEAIPQIKTIELPVGAVSHSIRVEGYISNSAEPSLAKPYHIEEDLQFDIAKEFSIIKNCNGTILASQLSNRVILSIKHWTCGCGSFIDFTGSLRYEIKYSVEKEQLIESGTFTLVQREFLEKTIYEPFAFMQAYDKKTKIILLDTEYSNPNSAQSLLKSFQVIGGRRYKIQFVYAIPDSDEESAKYNLTVKAARYQRFFNWIECKDINLEHSRYWKKYETVIRVPELSSELKVDIRIIRNNSDKDFGEILLKEIIFEPLDGFKETGP
jgi:hypothetical protein